MRTNPSSQAQVATYRRRRLGVAVVASCTMSFAVIGACNVLGADPGGGPASAAGVQPAVAPESVVVRPGDTLWSVAERVYARERRDGADVIAFADYVDALVARNGGAAVAPGDVVVLP